MLGHKQKLLGHMPVCAGAWLRHCCRHNPSILSMSTVEEVKCPGTVLPWAKLPRCDDCLRDEVCTRVLLLYQSHQSARRERKKRGERGRYIGDIARVLTLPPSPLLVSEPDPRKIGKEGLAYQLGWKCTLQNVRNFANCWTLQSL